MAKPAATEPDRVRALRLFVSSPGDVADERAAVAGIVERINDALGERHGSVLKTWRWEKNAVRRLGAAPQKVVDEQTPDYDIYLGIMSARFGTPGEGYGSGTEKEFRDALKRRSEEGRPEVLFYFQQSPPAPATADASRQLTRVLEFREELQGLGLVGVYQGLEGGDEAFVHRVQQDLVKTVLQLLAPPEDAPEAAAQDPSRYLRWLLSRCSHLDIRGLNVGTGEVYRLPIEQLYVALRTHGPRPESKQRPAGRSRGKSAAAVLDRELAGEARHVDLRQALADPRLVVVGDPGSGQDHVFAARGVRAVQAAAVSGCVVPGLVGRRGPGRIAALARADLAGRSPRVCPQGRVRQARAGQRIGRRLAASLPGPDGPRSPLGVGPGVLRATIGLRQMSAAARRTG